MTVNVYFFVSISGRFAEHKSAVGGLSSRQHAVCCEVLLYRSDCLLDPLLPRTLLSKNQKGKQNQKENCNLYQFYLIIKLQIGVDFLCSKVLERGLLKDSSHLQEW